VRVDAEKGDKLNHLIKTIRYRRILDTHMVGKISFVCNLQLCI